MSVDREIRQHTDLAAQARGLRPIEPDLVLIPAGEFLMGRAPGDVDFPQHRVHVSAFRIGKYEVTNAEFRRFVDLSHFRTDAEVLGGSFVRSYGGVMPDASWRHPGGKGTNVRGAGRHPVIHVSWRDALAYCRWLEEWTGKAYRLPTEAEWEKAASGPENRAFGHGGEQDPKKANVRASRNGGPVAVGSYPPNGYGLFDVDGNVAEWVADSHAQGYHEQAAERAGAGPERDAKGPPECADKLIKGDSFHGGTFANYCWNAGRSDASHDFIGFRVACDA